jgi:trans-aconitate methyltransferase
MIECNEAVEIKQRYARREKLKLDERYSMLNPAVWHGVQERQSCLLRLFSKLKYNSFNDISLLEIGCGSGGNLLEFLRMGFKAQNIQGVELLKERVAQAKSVLPDGIVFEGDACSIDISPESKDIVFQSVVFSSLLDDDFQKYLAKKMWDWVRPGGGCFGMISRTIILVTLMCVGFLSNVSENYSQMAISSQRR